MQTSTVPVCSMDIFGSDIRSFWISDLTGLLERFPILELAHTQDFYMLCFLESGAGMIELDHYRIELDQSKAIVFKPNCISSIQLSYTSKGKLLCFHEDFFSLRYNNNILGQFSFLKADRIPYFRLSAMQRDKWTQLCQLIHQEYLKTDPNRSTVLRSYLNIILFEWDRLFSQLVQGNSKNQVNDKIIRFQKLVEEHYVEKKLPSAYAEMLHISPNHLTRLCKEEIGLTPGEVIRRRILLEAKRMLHYTSLSVKEIAEKLGFESNSYFVTFFKKDLGMTPEQFRRSEG